MTRELQLRDAEILTVLDVMLVGAQDDLDQESSMRETAKRCDCSPQRIDEALKRAMANSEHLYWKQA